MSSSTSTHQHTSFTRADVTAADANVKVRAIEQVNERTLGILWSDGRADTFDVVRLRQACPCASCIDEWTHEPRLRPEDVAETTRPIRIESVGSYALKIHFNDGHATGIYTFQMLRGLANNQPSS